MPEAFILFKTEPSMERSVWTLLDDNAAVVEVHALYGEFDLLAHVSAEDSKTLTSMLMQVFRVIDGVKETRTMIAVDY